MMDQTKSPMAGLSLDKKSLLQPICKGTNEIAATIALDYYSTDPKEKKAIVAQLVQYGITIEMIEAKAMQIAGGGLLMFDRMIGNRETSRRLLRKELERRSESQNNGVASPSVVPKQRLANQSVCHRH
jgi:hypothetical protein